MGKINWKFWITVVLLGFSVWALYPSVEWSRMSDEKKAQVEKEKKVGKVIKLGLDLKGGTSLLLEVDSSKLDESINVKDATSQAIEVIRNRVDQFGVAEPMISMQGDKWIVVQLPGIKDPKVAKDLIGKTALLEFRIVNTSKEAMQVLELLRSKGITPVEYRENPSRYPDIKKVMPKDASVYESKDGSGYYVLDKSLLTGAHLNSKQTKVDNRADQFGFANVVVNIEFDKEGGKIFSDITGNNKGKQLAIVLDDIVQSAPMINSRIPDGKGIIEGNFTYESAGFLAMTLRAGALPAPVKIIEERTVGPSLGDDAIQKGFMSAAVGLIIVLLFMFVYYRTSGLIADFALVINFVILMAFMAYFQFTLTLPGVAGIALTLAMAVDANVLILERIREELAAGKTPRVAVDAGYKKVFWTIFDANVTSLIAAVFLFQFGTGPIKGFAVTLSMGLIISMFTAIVVTKLIYDFLFRENFMKNFKI